MTARETVAWVLVACTLLAHVFIREVVRRLDMLQFGQSVQAQHTALVQDVQKALAQLDGRLKALEKPAAPKP